MPWQRGVLAALAGAVLALLAGCVAIPTDGPIGTGDVVLDDPAPALPLANDPPIDGSPEEIVNGFLAAGAAGLRDEFVVARMYLDPLTASAWDPTARVLVYPLQGGGPQIEVRDDGSALVTVPIEGSLDAAGVYTEAPADAQEELVLELAQDADDQWRITSLEDGVLIGASSFDNLYRQVPVYFASTDGTQLVPDVRWFPAARIATYAVRGLLAGPSSWLRDVVVTGAPQGTRLSAEGVTVSDQVATVALSGEAGAADEAQRNLLLAQLSATLAQLPGSATSVVQVSAAGGAVWESTATQEPARDVAPTSGPYLLADARLAALVDGAVEPVEDAAALDGLDPRDPAVSLDDEVRVVLSGAGRLLLLPAGGEQPVVLLDGTALVAPSIDRFDWVWTAEQLQVGGLTAVAPSGEVLTVAADWLEGRRVLSLRVARDGSRVAVVHAGAAETGVVVDVAAVVRDEEGRPQRLGSERMQVGAALGEASEVVWVDEQTVAVLGRSGSLSQPALHLVPVGGPSSALSIVDGTTGIAAGRGTRELFVADADGALRSRQGASWVLVTEGVADPAFPG